MLVSLAQAGAGDWTAAGTSRDVTLAFRDDSRLAVREVRAMTELPFPRPAFSRSCVTSRTTDRSCPVFARRRCWWAPHHRTTRSHLRYAPRFLVVSARDVVVHVQGQSLPDGSSM